MHTWVIKQQKKLKEVITVKVKKLEGGRRLGQEWGMGSLEDAGETGEALFLARVVVTRVLTS